MSQFLLVLNAGSSSLKFALYQLSEDRELIDEAHGQVEGIASQPRVVITGANDELLLSRKLSKQGLPDHAAALALIQQWLKEHNVKGQVIAVGHRVVHGGRDYNQAVRIDGDVLADLKALTRLAPLHQAHNLAPIEILLESNPEIPQVACFDTAFHHTMPDYAKWMALPRHYAEQGVIRYGFHGLSYSYIASILAQLNPALEQAKVIVAHLGNGASLCALHRGRSVATTMGFSPLDGLIMGTRCGSIDPGVLLYLLQHELMNPEQLQHLLYQESGLLGISGSSSDMRELLCSPLPEARQAIDMFVYQAVREIGSLITILGGVDAFIFTGGIGEHADGIRERISDALQWMGCQLDHSANQEHAKCISLPASRISLWVVPCDENIVIARQTCNLLDS